MSLVFIGLVVVCFGAKMVQIAHSLACSNWRRMAQIPGRTAQNFREFGAAQHRNEATRHQLLCNMTLFCDGSRVAYLVVLRISMVSKIVTPLL